MRVCYVCADLGVPVFGTKGCSIHVREIVRSFLRRCDQVDMFVAQTGGDVPDEFSPCGLRVVSPNSTCNAAEREVAAQNVADRIVGAMESKGPYDLVYERHSLWSWAGSNYAQNHDIPLILEINAPLIHEQRKHRTLIDEDLAFNISQSAFHGATSLAVVSEEVGKALTKDFKINSRKLHVVPNGVDIRRFSPSVTPQMRSEGFTIGFVGSLKPWHGVETLLEAFQLISRECPTSRLLIIGDGPLRCKLQETYCSAASDIADRVQWVGAVSANDVPGYLTSMDVAVAPYPDLADFYFSPLKVFEYMACGLTTVTSDIGQLQSMITNRVDGFLYKPGSVASLASTLSMLADQPSVCAEVGKRARKRAVEEFTWDQVLERSLATLQSPNALTIPKWFSEVGGSSCS